jgi:predicted alpha-1,6-mannanase (GH76 family)
VRSLCIVLALAAACGRPGDSTPSTNPDGDDGAPDAAAITGDGPGSDAGSDTGSGSAVDAAAWHAHADDAVAHLLLDFWSQSATNLEAASPSSGSVTGYWTFAQALDAVEDGVARTNGARYAGWIEALYLVQNAIGWSRDYYDDENWMALALIRAYDLEHQQKYLDEAKALYADIEAAWDTTCCGAHPGGIWWDRPHTQKATAANGGPVIAGVQLAARTNDSSYLTFAEKVYTYWFANMVNPTTFAVSDHILPSGSIVNYNFTYNEGLVIGAAVALYGATNDASYLADANHVAGHVLAAQVKNGVLNDGTNTGCGGDCQQFKGIGYRYLAALQAVSPDPRYAAVLDASAQAIWSDARAPAGTFATDWAGPTVTSTSIDADSSATMALNIYAASLGTYAPSSTHYEAEDGVVHAMGLEAAHGTFSGWGYLAGWNGDGQWVDFAVSVPTAGAYTLKVRYAAGAGDAARLVYINGANAVATQKFASTTSWDTWATASIPIELPAGASTISIIYNSSLSSSNYLNLDYIDVDP